ncbi:hypothetical protein [Haloechinothrix alba]|uniref:hypothetical protein n=1 Tax=Haloechinothrix alba TaxID=664784 RepID=UPI001594EAFE|nr:hypothetical protein [Haloechinothrix alba]
MSAIVALMLEGVPEPTNLRRDHGGEQVLLTVRGGAQLCLEAAERPILPARMCRMPLFNGRGPR